MQTTQFSPPVAGGAINAVYHICVEYTRTPRRALAGLRWKSPALDLRDLNLGNMSRGKAANIGSFGSGTFDANRLV
jgi:hypothetical protein